LNLTVVDLSDAAGSLTPQSERVTRFASSGGPSLRSLASASYYAGPTTSGSAIIVQQEDFHS